MIEKRTNQGKWVSDLHLNNMYFKIITRCSAKNFVLPTSRLKQCQANLWYRKETKRLQCEWQ